MIVRFTVPYPPTTNLIWRVYNGHMTLSSAARAYKEKVAQEALIAGDDYVGTFAPCFQDHDLLKVTLNLYRPRKQGDIDNASKLILDGMQKVTYSNDSQIIELHILRHDDKDNPRVEVEVVGVATKPVKTSKKRSAKLF